MTIETALRNFVLNEAELPESITAERVYRDIQNTLLTDNEGRSDVTLRPCVMCVCESDPAEFPYNSKNWQATVSVGVEQLSSDTGDAAFRTLADPILGCFAIPDLAAKLSEYTDDFTCIGAYNFRHRVVKVSDEIWASVAIFEVKFCESDLE